ncbi:hypothetical protein P9705_001240 [Enterococcus faecalis]|nr:hypothetical protein [Enterococcus faecalis]
MRKELAFIYDMKGMEKMANMSEAYGFFKFRGNKKVIYTLLAYHVSSQTTAHYSTTFDIQEVIDLQKLNSATIDEAIAIIESAVKEIHGEADEEIELNFDGVGRWGYNNNITRFIDWLLQNSNDSFCEKNCVKL